jgi:hypothetical protein
MLGHGVYPTPIGSRRLGTIDVRDMGESAALELVRREDSDLSRPIDRINLAGPDTLTGGGNDCSVPVQ